MGDFIPLQIIPRVAKQNMAFGSCILFYIIDRICQSYWVTTEDQILPQNGEKFGEKRENLLTNSTKALGRS